MDHPYKNLKKINLHKFVKQHLPNHSIFDIMGTVETDDGEVNTPFYLVGPNLFKSSAKRYALKINKETSEATIELTEYKVSSDNPLKDISIYQQDYHAEFSENFKHNNVKASRIADIITEVINVSNTYKFYQGIDIKPFLKHLEELVCIKYGVKDVSTYLVYDVVGGILPNGKQHKNYAFFEVSRKSFLNNDIEINEMIKLEFPIRSGEIFTIFITNNGGEEQLYGLIGGAYIHFKTEQDLKDHANEMFFNAYKKSVYYKFDVEITELTDDYITLLEIDNI